MNFGSIAWPGAVIARVHPGHPPLTKSQFEVTVLALGTVSRVDAVAVFAPLTARARVGYRHPRLRSDAMHGTCLGGEASKSGRDTTAPPIPSRPSPPST